MLHDVAAWVSCKAGHHAWYLRRVVQHGGDTGHEHTHYYYGCRRCPVDTMTYTPIEGAEVSALMLIA